MSILGSARRGLNSFLNQHGYDIIESSALYDWQIENHTAPSHADTPLPVEAKHYLKSDNPRLQELKTRYAACDHDVTTPMLWQDSHVTDEDILYFRGDNAYVWQLRGRNMNTLGYALTTYYIKSLDKLGLLDKLGEDQQFGNYTFDIDHRSISRDLLDSVNEMYFLDRHMGLFDKPNLKVLDIGSGYGRLGYRMTSALENLDNYFCTDAFPVSSFICEYYLQYRGVDDRAKMAPLDEVDAMLAASPVDLAVNIHSFSECNLEAIQWWLNLLEKHQVPNLMIIPNLPELKTNKGLDFRPMVEAAGYTLKAQEAKYLDPVVQQFGINPSQYFLFSR